jgi:putative aldouronate transport system substrate-binding protein
VDTMMFDAPDARPALSRRAFVARLGGGALAALAVPLLAACTGQPAAAPTAAPAKPTTAPAPAAPTTAPAAAATPAPAAPAATAAPAVTSQAVVSRSGRVQLPTYLPPVSPPPQVPGTRIVPNGYTVYPLDSLVKSVPNPPGRGGDISIMTQTVTTLPTSLDGNQLWQEANKRIGANLQFSITPFADYGAKVPTILAGNDLPDILYLPAGQPVPGFPQFLEAKAADLTPYLSGDAIKEYPNLGSHPTSVWKTTVINNKIFGVGTPLAPFFWVHWMHQELLESIGSESPKSAADYKRIMQALSKPNEGVYGLVGEGGYQYGYGTINQLITSIFGGANQWSLNGGKLTRLYETDEFKQSVEYARDLWTAGLYDPSSPSYNTLSAREHFVARSGVFRWDGNVPDIYSARWAPAGQQPPPKIRLVPPFPAQEGGKPTFPLFSGNFGTAVLKKAPEARIKELLGVINYLAAPFGTEERHFLSNGFEGIHHTINERGNPVVNDKGRADAMPWNGVTNPAPSYFNAFGDPSYVEHIIPVFKEYEAVGVEDPTVGYYSDAAGRVGVVANQRFGDGVNDVILGRRPFSDLTGLIQEWRSGGGDQVRKEIEEAMAGTG